MRLGPYQIIERIGAGGMGEVYRARDPRLERDVAIKVIAPSRAASPDAIARFEVEARAVAALSHPNIVAIYDVGTDNGRLYLVEELCQGETLRERLERGPIPWRKAAEIGAAIASGAAAAHERGIVHRDLKPENVFLTRDGHVKVLDFGLARRRGLGDGEASTRGADTDPGTVMGTAGYMSPEQVRGEIADARTDIFALGSVLYEMVTGRRAFKGDTSAETMAAIINSEPAEVSSSGQMVPPDFAGVIRHCHEKRAGERFQSARDLAFALRALSGSGSGSGSGSTAALLPTRRPMFAVLAAGLLLAVAAAGWWGWSSRRGQPQAGPAELRLQRVTNTGRATDAAISPDGRYVAYVATDGGKSILRLRQLATGSDLDLASAEDLGVSGFSTDGNYVDYVVIPPAAVAGTLYRVPALGGQARRLLDDVSTDVAFSPDGRAVAFSRLKADFSAVDLIVAAADGTAPRVLRTYGITNPGQPHWSADGRELLFTDQAADKTQALTALNVGDGTSRRLTERTWPVIRSSAWLPDGRGFLITASEREARAQVWHISTAGEARQLTHDLLGFGEFRATADGDTIVTTTVDNLMTIWTGGTDGRTAWRAIEQGAGRSGGGRGIDWIPDGRIVYTAKAGNEYQIWVMNADGSGRRQLTFGAASTFPDVSPDGRSVAFRTKTRTLSTIHLMNVDGSNVREIGDVEALAPTWTPDGRSIVFLERKQGKPEIRRVPAAGGPSTVINRDLFNTPKVSPDGRWLAGLTDQGQQIRVGLVPYPDGGPRRVLENVPAEATGVDWTPDSRALVVTRNGNLWSYPIDGSAPTQVTSLEGEEIGFYALGPNGKLAVSRWRTTSDIVTITGLRALVAGK